VFFDGNQLMKPSEVGCIQSTYLNMQNTTMLHYCSNQTKFNAVITLCIIGERAVLSIEIFDKAVCTYVVRIWMIFSVNQSVCINFTDVNGVCMPIWPTARQQPGTQICLELTTRTWLAGQSALAMMDQLQIIYVSIYVL
jgi:hypothetical protein